MGCFLKKYHSAIIMAIIAVCIHVVPANAVTTQGNVGVIIQNAITVTELQAINFGVLRINPASTSQFILNPDGSFSSFGDINQIGSVNTGQFVTVGLSNAAISIDFTNGELNGPGDAMVLDQLSHNAGVTPVTDHQGNLMFNVGGRLNVNAGQIQGAYSGTYAVSVNYQ